jgi:hypothetical protein
MTKRMQNSLPWLWIGLYPACVYFLYEDTLRSQITSHLALLISAMGLILALVRFSVELRLTRAARHTDLMLKFEERFEGNEMKLKRKAAASFLLVNRTGLPVDDLMWHKVDDVLDFFEVIGTLVKQGDENPALAYSFFHYWFSHYWVACKKYVEAIQQEAPVQWEEASWLFEKMHAIEIKRNKSRNANPSPDDLEIFFNAEIGLEVA